MKMLKGKIPFVIIISLLLSLTGLTISLTNPRFLKPVQNIVFDTFQQIKPREKTDSLVVIIDIDEASLAELGQWPWPRNEIGSMVEKVAEAGSLAIGFDIVFSEIDRTSPKRMANNLPENLPNRAQVSDILGSLPDNDAVFANAISKSPVVLGFFNSAGTSAKGVEKKAGISWLGEDLTYTLPNYKGNVSSLQQFQTAASGQGYITLGTDDVDEIIRTVPMFTQQSDRIFPALSIETMRIAIQNAMGELQSFLIKTTFSGTEGGDATGASGNKASITYGKVANFEFPLTADGELIVYYAKDDPLQRISASKILTADPQWLAETFQDKIVLVGVSAVGLRDIRKTTLRESVPGVTVHAQIIDQIMQGSFLVRPDWAPGAEAVLAILLTLIIVILSPSSGAIASAIIGGVCALNVGAISWFSFSWYGLLIDPTSPLMISFAAYLLMTLLMYFFAEREKRFVRNAFQHYLAPNLLAKLEANPDSLQLGGEIRHMTLMFMDVRNFTPISEKLDPQQLVSFLNQLLSPISDIIQQHEGAIDKYIGDSVMAFWNAPLDVDDHATKACRAALAILVKVKEMNAANAFGFQELGLGEVKIGVGINTGDGCVGNMGSSSRFDYSVIGDTVNVAARLEAATKEVKWPLVVSSSTASLAQGLAFLDAGELALKGKTGSSRVYALVGDETFADGETFKSLVETHTKMLLQKGKKRSDALGKCLTLCEPELIEFISR